MFSGAEKWGDSACKSQNSVNLRFLLVMVKMGLYKGCDRAMAMIELLARKLVNQQWKRQSSLTCEKKTCQLPLDIYNHYIATTTTTFDPGPISMETFKTRIVLNHDLYKAYAIHHEGEIAGFCLLGRFREHKSYERTAKLGVYLKPEHTRQGLGTKAIGHLEQVAAAGGLKVIVAGISGENEGSIALFEKLRWEQCAHFKRIGEKWGRAMDLIYFQRSLENDITASSPAIGNKAESEKMANNPDARDA